MLRIHVTERDLGRIRVAQRPDPLWETVLSCHRFRDRRAPQAYDAWRAAARHRVGSLPPTLHALIPLAGYFPDFLTPWQSRLGLLPGIEALRATPRDRLRAQIERLAAARPLPRWASALAEGDPATLGRLVRDLYRYHRLALSGDHVWPRVTALVDADRTVRLRHLLAGGVEGLLAGLRPVLRWNPPVIEADYPVERELSLDGRGLLLIPSFFCWRLPVTLAADEEGGTPVLVYPIQHACPAPPGEAALARLLGETRARLLTRVAGGATTGELARRAGVSPASASEHTGVLRRAGLILSVRRGNEVLHTLTPLGLGLLAEARADAR